jgi:hypothetical protein
MARWLRWVVVGAASMAVLWVGATTVTASAMEPPPLIAPHGTAIDAAALTKADPLAFVEPPPLALVVGAATASAIARPEHALVKTALMPGWRGRRRHPARR